MARPSAAAAHRSLTGSYPDAVTVSLRLLGSGSWRDRPITSGRTRVLLALLATEPGGFAATHLAEQLWPEDPPANPAKALQVLVSRARTALAPEVVLRTTVGYRLGLAPEQVDLTYAGMLATTAAAALAAHDPARALALADEGLALWASADPDPAVLDVLGGSAVDVPAMHGSLQRTHALALHALGRHTEALGALESVVAAAPDDDVARAAHLRSLARAVSRAAALERFEEHRRDLRDRLGADPGPPLREVQAELLDDTPPVRHGVRHDANRLVGRDDDLAALHRLVRATRVTSIVGSGGLGKTRLAMALAVEVQATFVHVVELAGVATGDGVLPEVAAVLGARSSRGRMSGSTTSAPADLLSAVVEQLSAAPTLLVLDNCEHVIDAAARLVDTLVARAPRLRVLTTSRSPLDIGAEAVYLLPQLDEATSVELFIRRATAVRADIDLPHAVVTRLCGQLDGLPLAIELAAAKVRVMSVTEIERRLENRFALLRGTSRSAPARHQTLLAVIDWSWNLLTESQRAALRRLAVFQDGFTLDAASVVVGPEAETEVAGLVGQSLLAVAEAPFGTRYRMLETVREFALMHLVDAGEDEAAGAAMRQWATAYAARWGTAIFGAEQFAAVDHLRAEESNLTHALDEAVAAGEGDCASSTFAALAGLWSIESNHLRVLGVAPDVDALLYHHRPGAGFVEVHRSALAILAVNAIILTPRLAARSLCRLRRLPPSGRHTFTDVVVEVLVATATTTHPDRLALEAFRHRGEELAAALACAMASQLFENEGEIDLAMDYAASALASAESVGDPWSLAGAHQQVAELSLQTGAAAAADLHAEAAIPTLERLGAAPDVAQLRAVQVLAALHRGDLDRAESLLPAVGHTDRSPGFGLNVMEFTLRAELALARGRTEEGLHHFRTAVQRSREMPVPTVFSTVPGLEPWTLHTEAACLAAHVQHDALAEDPQLGREAAAKAQVLLARPDDQFFDFPVVGCVLFALGLLTLAPAGTPGVPALDPAARARLGARLLAMSARFGHARNYPALSAERGRAAARAADGAAYDSAVESYAALDRLALRAEAVALVDGLYAALTQPA